MNLHKLVLEAAADEPGALRELLVHLRRTRGVETRVVRALERALVALEGSCRWLAVQHAQESSGVIPWCRLGGFPQPKFHLGQAISDRWMCGTRVTAWYSIEQAPVMREDEICKRCLLKIEQCTPPTKVARALQLQRYYVVAYDFGEAISVALEDGLPIWNFSPRYPLLNNH